MSYENNHKVKIRSGLTFDEFSKVFGVFSPKPFYEKWSEESLRKEFELYKQKNSEMLGYFVDDVCAGLITIRPNVQIGHPVKFPKDAKVMYLSDVAVIPKYRGNGIGIELTREVIEHTKALGYDYMYLRTNEKHISMSYGIVARFGFKEVENLRQIVTFPRVSKDVPEEDTRIFMVKKL